MTNPIKKTKRNISKLENSFRESICDYAIEHNLKCAHALLVLKATGCRPDELEKGVRVNLENNILSFKILGSKLNKRMKRGILIREIKIDVSVENKYLKPIIDVFINNPGAYDYKIQIESKKAFSGYITKISKKLWPRKHYHASAYSFRHAKATDLKNSDKTKIEIAKILGHASIRSQNSYGRKSSKSKGGYDADEIAEVSTSSEPRGSDRLLRFKIASKNKAAAKASGTVTAAPSTPATRTFKR